MQVLSFFWLPLGLPLHSWNNTTKLEHMTLTPIYTHTYPLKVGITLHSPSDSQKPTPLGDPTLLVLLLPDEYPMQERNTV